MDKAIITGTFSECKFVKTRSVMQIVIEVPIESADAGLAVLGGVPQPGAEVHVAVARLATRAEPRVKARSGSLAAQSAMMCGEPTFMKFLENRCDLVFCNDTCAAEMVRQLCDVKSRAEFDTDEAAGRRWKNLYLEYKAWSMI